MGWGLELDWIDLGGLPLGIVDAVRGPPPRQGLAAPTTTPRSARGCARSSRSAASTTGPRSSGRSPSGGRGSGVRRGGRRDASGVEARPTGRRRFSSTTGTRTPSATSIEALRRCQAYHAADPSLRISLVLNGASPTELATCVPFVERAFAVPYSSFGAEDGDPRRALRGVPRDWDHVVHHPASIDPEQQRFEGLQALLRGRAAALPRSPERGCHRRRRRLPTRRTRSCASTCRTRRESRPHVSSAGGRRSR